MYEGVGIRHFLDIAVLTKNCKEMNWDILRNELSTIGMWEFAEKVLAFNSMSFSVKPPININDLDTAFYNKAVDTILKNGVFGFNNADNRGSHAVNKIRNERNKKWGMVKHMFLFVFPPYRSLKINPAYRFIDGKPYLLPLVWVYRFIRGTFLGRTRKALAITADNFVSDEGYNKRVEWLSNWGL